MSDGPPYDSGCFALIGKVAFMPVLRFIVAASALALVSACMPGPDGQAPAGVSQEKYERHRANRQAYMFQGR